MHFPVDNVAGRILGKVLGEYFVYLCDYKWKGWNNNRPEPSVKPWNYGEFNGFEFDGNLEFDPATQRVRDFGKRPPFYEYHRPQKNNRGRAVPLNGTKRAPVLKTLFRRAQEECAELGISF